MIESIVLQEYDTQAFERAEAVIKDGGLVVAPTDTVYGIMGDATQATVIERLYELKQRPHEKAFPVFVRDIAMARWFAYISDVKAQFLTTIWPGPVTAIFHHKEKLPPILTVSGDTIGLRMPNAPFIRSLLNRLQIPLVQSSANISGSNPATTVEDIMSLFDTQEQKPDLVIDGGEIKGASSSVIDFTANEPRLIRSGLMNKNEFELLCVRLKGDAG